MTAFATAVIVVIIKKSDGNAVHTNLQIIIKAAQSYLTTQRQN